MKLYVFYANDGDCILVQSNGAPKRNILFDGGRSDSYSAYTGKQLPKLVGPGGKIDVVCVSHVDDDHLAGVLKMVEDEVTWRAYEAAKKLGAKPKAPKVTRPPEIGEFWHNNLFDLVGDGAQAKIEPVLGNVASLLAGVGEPTRRQTYELENLASGFKSSMELRRRISDSQLGIPLNARAKGKLLKRKGSGAPAADRWKLGSLDLSLLGPTQTDIDALRKKWQIFLTKSAADVDKLHDQMRDEEKRLGLSAPIVANPIIGLALGEGWKGISPENVASLMFLVEEGGKKVLMTGDARAEEILPGLRYHKQLPAGGTLHVDVLKVQHHGALGNINDEFVAVITADHYFFCGNGGASGNPEIEVVQELARARTIHKRGPARPFKFWFTASSQMPLSASQKKRMKALETEVAKLKKGHPNMQAEFLGPDDHFELTV